MIYAFTFIIGLLIGFMLGFIVHKIEYGEITDAEMFGIKCKKKI